MLGEFFYAIPFSIKIGTFIKLINILISKMDMSKNNFLTYIASFSHFCPQIIDFN